MVSASILERIGTQMLFSSSIFLYMFLPTVLAIYYIPLRFSRALQNAFLLAASLFFYAWGEPSFVLVMMLSVIANYIFGLLVEKNKDSSTGKLVVGISVVFNLVILFIFKYLAFVVRNMNALLGASIPVPEIALPIGISFFTFQAMSYVFDVYAGRGEAQRNLLNVGLYISFFPQLIAGPIVRYQTVAEEIKSRRETLADFSNGFSRFIVGLSKKVLLANTFALVADMAFQAVSVGKEISVALAWLGAVCYTLQIFFDFSGYSDMAIGLGAMFGFHFLENFDYPYISTSITEFWRRWHISLGSWFRDYVYIPLGGSRGSRAMLVRNLFLVWLLTGIWHGANWTFIIWGLMYFVLLTIEKLTGFSRNPDPAAKPIRWLYTILFVVIGWVIFRSDSVADAITYVGSMLGLYGNPFTDGLFATELQSVRLHLPLGILFSMPLIPWVKGHIKQGWFSETVSAVLLIGLFLLSLANLVSSSYNPFIYFNF